MKPIRWTEHARKKLASRDLSIAEVEMVISSPDTVTAGRPPRRILTRRYFDETLGSEMLLRVVVEETDEGIAVITLYKTSSFKKYAGGT